MTKTTSYEISKKLKEAGFEAEADYNFIERNNQKAFLINIKELSSIEIMNEIGVFIKSYDLETLLYALPKINKQEYLLCSGGIVYLNDYISVGKEKNESLADTAGRLLIELFEAGIINFKK